MLSKLSPRGRVPAPAYWPPDMPSRGLWKHQTGGAWGSSGPSALPTEDILSELLSNGIQPLVQEIRERFTSSLVSAGWGGSEPRRLEQGACRVLCVGFDDSSSLHRCV